MTSCTSGLPRLRTAFTHRLDVPSKVYLERSGFHPAEAIVDKEIDSARVPQNLKRLEDCLNSFVRALVRAADALEKQQRAAEERERQWEEQRKQRAREEEARRAEAERVQRLDKQLASWRAASEIRAFVREARELFERGAGPPAQETDEYLNWALGRADELDPVSAL
jgi:hypothetical protein